jgi:hypothetical protein
MVIFLNAEFRLTWRVSKTSDRKAPSYLLGYLDGEPESQVHVKADRRFVYAKRTGFIGHAPEEAIDNK